MSLCYEPIAKPLMLWLAGDSTVTDQQSTAYSRLGPALAAAFRQPRFGRQLRRFGRKLRQRAEQRQALGSHQRQHEGRRLGDAAGRSQRQDHDRRHLQVEHLRR